MKLERYGIYWADLNPVIGGELDRTRPVVIVSDDLMNNHLKTVVTCPLTTAIHPEWRSRIQIEVKGRPCEIAVDQIRAVSKKRLLEKITALDRHNALKLRLLISEMYGESAE